MPLYVIDSNTLEQKFALERSPEVLLLTDATNIDSTPLPIRQAADRTGSLSCGGPEIFRGEKRKNPTLVWMAGETLLEGAAELIRHNLRLPGRTSFISVHFPCLPKLDLLAIQPRFFGVGGRKEEAVDFTIRLAWGGAEGQGLSAVLQEMREPWARLSCALYQDQAKPGEGLAQLDRLRRDEKMPPLLDALVLRNLVVLQARHGRPQQALKLLQQGRRKYTGYAELGYIEACLALESGDVAQAVILIEQIIGKPKGVFIGSGGETTYRAQSLVGAIGDLVGNQSIACGNYQSGISARPPFEPSVVGFLKQRLPNGIVDSIQWELCHLVRREPRYFDPVFYFFLVHRAFFAANRLLDTMNLDERKRDILLDKFNSVRSSYRKRPAGSVRPTGVILTGPFFLHSSIARINGELAASLLSHADFCTGLEPHGFAIVSPRIVNHGETLVRAQYRRPPHLDLTIRHHWPHDFSAPETGKLATIVPWEFGAVPRAWVDQIEKNVDELWVPSAFVRDVFIRCGVRAERIAVVPNGVNIAAFCPDGQSWKPAEARGFTFLFVGGTIGRKGVDILLKAYQRAFTNQDDVSLVIKDIGSTGFYRHMTVVPFLLKESKKPENPRMVVLLDDMDEMKLSELYRGCDALVLPYRGEGFGMPLIEAMACDKPVITTGEGPAREFCPEDCSYLLPAKVEAIPGGIPGFGELAGEPTWFEPDPDDLAGAMREVYENQAEAAIRGARAGEIIRPAYNWRHVTEMYIERIAALTSREISQAAPAMHPAD